MKKLLTFLTLLTLFFSVGWATEVTYTFGSNGYDIQSTETFTDGDFTISFGGTWNVQNAQFRPNQNASITFNYSNGVIKKLVFTASSDAYQLTIDGTTVTDGTNAIGSMTSPGTWEYSTGSSTVVVTNTTTQRRLKSVTITYEDGGSTTQTVATPTFSPAAGTYYDPVNVTLNCATTGATIRYTLDGTDPTATTGTVYNTSPISVTSTTTIKAIATATGYDPSSVASATYTIVTPKTVTIPYEESFAGTFGDFYTKTVTNPGFEVWNTSSYQGKTYAKAAAYKNSTNYASESWLISPYINLANTTNPELSFSQAIDSHFGTIANEATLWVKENNASSTWTQINIDYPDAPSSGYTDFESQTISLSAYKNKTIQLAFVYKSTTSHAGNWEVTDFKVEDVDASAPTYYLVGSFNMNGTSWVTDDDNYKFEENNGTYTLNNVNFTDANTTFKVIKNENGQITWYGGTGDVAYNIHHRHHTNLPMNGSQNYTIQSAGTTSFSFTLDNNTPTNLNVNRTASLAIKGDFTNNWTEVPMTANADGWTTTQTVAVNNEFGFVDEFGQYIDILWTVGTEHLGTNIPMTTEDGTYTVGNYKMGIAGTYKFTANSDLTTLVITDASQGGDGDVYTLVESADDLVAGEEYLIVGSTNAAPYSAILGPWPASGNYATAIKDNFIYDSTNKTITVQDGCTATPLRLGGSTGAWTFYNGSSYLAYTGTSTSGNNSLWTVSNASDNGATWTIDTSKLPSSTTLIVNVYNTNRKLNYNNDRFAGYVNTQSAVALFKKASTTPPSDQVATPSITPGSTDATDPYIVYGGKQQITINCTTSGATIYYTTDGSNPTTSSNQYSEPFNLTSTGGNVTVKAIAVKDGLDDSEIATSYYRFTNPKAPTFDPATGAVRTEAFDVTISSEYDDAEIYYMLDPASAPTANTLYNSSNLYNDPVNVSGEGSHTIYAMVVRNGIKSSVVNATYTITSGTQPSGDGDYVKVTNASDLTDGEYLIVYEEGLVAFDGSLSTLDASGNTIDVEINDFTIPSTPTVDAAVFTIDVTAGTIKSASGYYIGKEAYANGLDYDQSTAYTNTITFDEYGNAVITADGGCTMRYNNNSDQLRFRYYKSGQQPVALYKKVDNNTVKTPVITPGSMRMTEAFDATITCATEGATIYYTLDGTTPTTNSAVYNGPIHIERPTVTLSAIAVLDGEQSTVATAVYSGVWVYNLAEYNALAQGTTGILFKNPVIVQYHYISGSGKSYIYVKDDTGCAYFHQPGGSIAQLENGDVIGAGFSGNKVADEMVSDEESNFFMLTNLVNFAPNGKKGLADPEHETVARIADATTGVALNNHYITIKKVKLSALYQPSTITYGGAKYFDIDNEAHIGYNKFNIDYSVVDDLDAYYNITGIQTAYNNVMEFHPTEIVKWEEAVVTLRELCDKGVTTEGENEYTISNNVLGVFAKDNRLWVKDDTGQSIHLTSQPDSEESYYIDAEGNTREEQAYYDQSNWLEVILPSTTANPTSAQSYVGKIINGGTIKGQFTNKVNPTLEVTSLPDAGAASSYEPNYYCMANFLDYTADHLSQQGNDGKTYFFMNPKPQEYAVITWAMWKRSEDSEDGMFVIPSKGTFTDKDGKSHVSNDHNFNGAFEADWSLNANGDQTSNLNLPGNANGMYEFHAIIRMKESTSNGAPRNTVSPKDGQTASSKYIVSPTDLDFSEGSGSIITAVNEVKAAGEVESVTYFNVAGMQSSKPFDGINIVVTRYTDGTASTTKVVK